MPYEALAYKDCQYAKSDEVCDQESEDLTAEEGNYPNVLVLLVVEALVNEGLNHWCYDAYYETQGE